MSYNVAGAVTSVAMRTTDLCDAHPDLAVAAPIFRDFGGLTTFSGPIVTLAVVEDNQRVRAALEGPGEGRVLVIDGAGSVRRALVGGNLGKLAEKNGWAGIVVFGAVRDTVELRECNVGIKALAAVPRKSDKTGRGQADVALTFADCTFRPGEHLYADEDGIVVSKVALR